MFAAMKNRMRNMPGSMLVGLVIAILVALVLVIEWVTGDHDAFFITLLIGVPVGLASTVTIVMSRRSS